MISLKSPFTHLRWMKFNEKNMKVTQSDAITKWARPFYWKNSSAGEADPRIHSHRGWLTGAKALKHDHLFLHLPHWKAQGPEISTQGSPVPPHASQNELIAEESIFKLWTPTLTHQNFLLSTSCPPPQKATKQNRIKHSSFQSSALKRGHNLQDS